MVIPPLAPCLSLYLPTGTQQRGFSLLELLLVLALLTILLWFAVPRYSAQQVHGRSAAMQLELLACVQTLHGLELAAEQTTNWPADHVWLQLADSNDDGVGDSPMGLLAEQSCALSSSTRNHFQINVRGSSAGFLLQAFPQNQHGAPTEVFVVDHLGRRRRLSEGL